MTETPVQTHDMTDGERKFLAKYGHLFASAAPRPEPRVDLPETSGENS